MAYYGFGEDIGWTIDGVNYIDFIDFETSKPIQIPAGLTDEKEILNAYFKESKIREYEKNIRKQLEARLDRGVVSDGVIRYWAEKVYRGEIEPRIEINFDPPITPDRAILLTFKSDKE